MDTRRRDKVMEAKGMIKQQTTAHHMLKLPTREPRGWAARFSVMAWILLGLALSGCAVNPVTGQREVRIVGEQRAIAMGAEQYGPSQQMQGGALRVDPSLQAYVTKVGNHVAAASGVNLPYEFVVLNNSTPNAWALPGGKIAINSGLLLILRNEAELAAVLAHEVAHAAAGHGVQKYQRAVFTEGLLVLASAGLQVAGVQGGNQVVGSARQGAQLLGLKYSRDAEREADFYGSEFMAKAGYDPMAAATLQEQFLALAGGQPAAGSAVWFASHPPSAERVANNRRRAGELRQDGYQQGRFEQAAFAQATRQLRARAPAYELYDEAVTLVEQDALDAAASSVSQALRQFDGEAKFHGLRGLIRARQNRYDDALTNLNRAVERDPNYFAHYLNRGEVWLRKGDRTRAKTDFNRSMRLLPTAAAQKGFVSLDISDNPAKYVKISVRSGEEGSVVQAQNQAGVDLSNVLVRVEREGSGSVRQETIRLDRLSAERPIQRQVDGVVRRAYAVSAEVR